jgi:hypothetical protein
VLEDAGEERVGQPGQSEIAVVCRVREQCGAVAPQRHVEVQPTARAVVERLRHERGGHPALLGQYREQVPRGDHPVCGGERVGVGEVLLELPIAVLVVVGVVAPAQLIHRRGNRGQMVVHPGQPAGVVAGAGVDILDVGRRQPSVRIPRDEEVLDLGPDEELQLLGPCALEQRLEDHARGKRPWLALDMRVAVHQRQPLAHRRHWCV